MVELLLVMVAALNLIFGNVDIATFCMVVAIWGWK
jgi:hypothetical protein